MGTIIKNTGIITAITLVAGLLLGVVYQVTKAPIALAEQNARERAYQEVFPDATDFTEWEDFDGEAAAALMDTNGCRDIIDNVVVAKSGDTLNGYIITVTSKEGFGGDIQVTMGVDAEGATTGMSILSISETAGLGMRATEPEFLDQFRDRQVTSFRYTKDGASAEDEIDALSGATITTNAMTNAANAGLIYYNEVLATGGE